MNSAPFYRQNSVLAPAKLYLASSNPGKLEEYRVLAAVAGRGTLVLDGEIVAQDGDGVPRFQLLQQWQKRPTAPVAYFLFHLVWCDGRDITGKTVVQRRERLQDIIAPMAGIQVGGYLENRGIDLYRPAKEKGLEGIIAKRKASIYQPGRRSPDWLKIKGRPQQEFVVGWFNRRSRQSPQAFLALCCSVHIGEDSCAISATPDADSASGD